MLLHVQVTKLTHFFDEAMTIAEVWVTLTEIMDQYGDELAEINDDLKIKRLTNLYLAAEEEREKYRRAAVKDLRSAWDDMKRYWVPEDRVFSILDWCLPADINPLRDETAYKLWMN